MDELRRQLEAANEALENAGIYDSACYLSDWAQTGREAHDAIEAMLRKLRQPV